MTNDIFIVQVCDEAKEISTKIITCNPGVAVKWTKFFVHECKYEESWILKVKFEEINFQFAALEKSPCVYLLSRKGLRFNNL